MRIALIGWQGGGKSTLFTACTGAQPVEGEEAHPGGARVPDEMLDRLHTLYPPAKKVNARVDYLDIAGLVPAHKKSGFKRSLINHLQGANVLAAVIGTFSLTSRPLEELAASVRADVTDLETELLLSDLQIAETRIERIKQSHQRGQSVDAIEEKAMEKAFEALNEEKALRDVEFDATEDKALRTYSFLSRKPMLIAVNHGEDQDGAAIASRVQDLAGEKKRVEALDCRLEAEIAVLEEQDRAAFLKEMGIQTPASDRVIRAGFNLLGLIRFFTVGDDEVRAWPIPRGMEAVEAAGEIHSDLERGFIRAEVVDSDHLLEKGSLSACRDAGLLRLEGKHYVVQDGDVMHIRFNV